MKIYMINVTLQVGMAAASIELAFTDDDAARCVFNTLQEEQDKQTLTPRTYCAKGRVACFRGRDIVCVSMSEMQTQGTPMFQ